MEKWQVSKHIHMVRRASDYAVYNKLFGNLKLLNQHALETLLKFSEPAAIDAVAQDPETQSLVAQFQKYLFLVREGADERDYIEADKRFRSEHLTSGYLLKGIQLVLTNDCNLGCSYCFQETISHAQSPSIQNSPFKILGSSSASSGGCGTTTTTAAVAPPAISDVKKMSPDTAITTVSRAIATVKKAGNEQLSIEFFGGEPLLNWAAITAVLDEFGDGSAHGVKLHYSITTNATRITDAIAKKLRQHDVTVTVSFDSPKNSSRTTKRGTSATDSILAGLDILSRNDSLLTFNTVVSVNNVHEVDVDGLLEIAKKHRVRVLGVILDLEIKPYEDHEGMAKVVDTVMRICERAQDYGIPVTGYWHQIFEQIAGLQPINLQKGYKTCAAEGCKLSFEPNGDVTHCKTVEKSIGSLDAMDDVFQSSWYKAAAMKAYETSSYCRGCMVEGFCSGLCMGTLQKLYNDSNAIAVSACTVYRNVTERLIQAIPSQAL
ncbi:MAG TPA: radical SAM protein [Candidatus Angelobacter sp.]|nr:radical SAM protein [Candidatus Angelobacter sp.]